METIASLSFWQPRQKIKMASEANMAAVRISMTAVDLITGVVAESRMEMGRAGPVTEQPVRPRTPPGVGTPLRADGRPAQCHPLSTVMLR